MGNIEILQAPNPNLLHDHISTICVFLQMAFEVFLLESQERVLVLFRMLEELVLGSIPLA